MGTKTYNNYEDLLTFTRASGGHALRPVSYGTELVTNGTFDTDSDWTDASTGDGSSSISGGKITITDANGGVGRAFQNITIKAGSLYEISFEASGTNNIYIVASALGINSGFNSGQTHVLKIVASASDLEFNLYCSGASGSASIDNLTLKEVLFDQPDGTLTLFEHPNNIPRVEWDAQRNRLGLLVEEARTNLMLYSEDFSQANWDKNNTSITSGTAVSPTGLQTADTLTATSTGNFRYIERGVSLTQNETYTFSVYLKYTDTQWVWLLGETSANTFFWFDIQNGVIGGSGGSTGNPFTGESYSHTIQDVGNGWYRCSITFTKSSASGTEEVGFGLANADVSTNATLNQTCLAYGPQLEVGAFPTSYIKTTGATATRSADVSTIPVADFGFNTGAGTFVAEFDFKDPNNDDANYVIAGTTTARIFYNNASQDAWQTYDGTAGVSFGLLDNTGASRFKAAVGVKTGKDVVTALDGAIKGSSTSATSLMENLAGVTLYVGGGSTQSLNGHIKSIKYYPRRLTNAQLQALTEPRSTPTLSLTFDGLESSYTENYIHG